MALRRGKQVEDAGRRVLLRVIAWLLRRSRPRPAPDWNARPHRVLLLRYDGIGDMILSTGLLRVIATSNPKITVDVLASSANAPVLRHDPHVARVLVFDKKKPWRYPATLYHLRRARYDVVVDRLPTAPSVIATLLMLASGARHRVGVSGLGNEAYFTLLVPPPAPGSDHMVERLAALAAGFGVDPRTADVRPRIYLSQRELANAAAVWHAHGGGKAGSRLLVNVSAAVARRRWPDERFVAAMRHVLARDPGLTVLVIGALGESDRAARLAGAAGAHFVVAGLREMLALVATADFVFTPNTSVAHAASAFRRPAVVMCPPDLAAAWGLYHSPGYELASPDLTLSSLPLEPVLDALDQLLGTDRDVQPSRRTALG